MQGMDRNHNEGIDLLRHQKKMIGEAHDVAAERAQELTSEQCEQVRSYLEMVGNFSLAKHYQHCRK